MNLSLVSLVVRDYDEAIEFFCGKLDFQLLEDTKIYESKRWVVVAPKHSSCSLLLAKAKNEEEEKFIGNQSGGRVFLFLESDDFWSDYKKMKGKGIIFMEEPRNERYGTVVVFKDLYGNKWDLIQINKNQNKV